MSSPRARIESLAATARRDPRDLQGILELGRLIERYGAPEDLLDLPLLEAVGEALWRRPDQRPLAHLLLRLVGLAPLERPDATVPPDFPLPTNVARGEAYDEASGLPLRLRLPDHDITLRWVPEGVAGIPRRVSRGSRSVPLAGFLIADTPLSCGQLEEFLAASGRRPPEDWEDQRAHPTHAARGLPPALARAAVLHLGLRLPRELEWCYAFGGPHHRATDPLEVRAASTPQGWLGIRGGPGFGWEWVEAARGGRHSVEVDGVRLRGVGGPTRTGQVAYALSRAAVPDNANPLREFGVRPARDLLPPSLVGRWSPPAAPAPASPLRLRPPPSPRPFELPTLPGEPATTLLPRPPLFHPGGATHLAWLEEPRWLISAGPRGLAIWAADTGAPVPLPPLLSRARAPIAVGEGFLYTSLAGGGMAEFSLPDLELHREVAAELGALQDLAVLPEQEALSLLDATGRLLDLERASGRPREVRPLGLHKGESGWVVSHGRRVVVASPRLLRQVGDAPPEAEDLGPGPHLSGTVVPAVDRRRWLVGWTTPGGRAQLQRLGASGPLSPEVTREVQRLAARRPLALDPTGREAVLTDHTSAVRLDLETARAGPELALPEGVLAAAYEDAGGEVALALESGAIVLWPPRSSTARLPTTPPATPPAALQLGQGGAVAWSWHPGSATPLLRSGRDPARVPVPRAPSSPRVPMVQVAASARGGDLAIVSGRGHVAILNAHTMELRDTWAEEVGATRAVAWDERRQRLLTTDGRSVSLWQRQAAAETWDAAKARGPVSIARNARALAYTDGTQLHLGRLEGARLESRTARLSQEARWLALAPDGTACAAWLTDDVLSVFRGSRPAGRLRPAELDAAAHPPLPLSLLACPVAVGPNGLWVARGLRDGSIEVHDLRRRTRLRRTYDHDGPVCWLATDPRGEFLASGGLDGSILVRSVR